MKIDLGTIVIDPTLREVRREGTPVKVEPMVFDLIVYLIENQARVVSKEDIIEAIWEGRAISDATLSGCIKAARQVLGDTGRAQRMIKTYHRRGFRFVGVRQSAPVTKALTDPASQPCADEVDLTPPVRPSIAVLPFTTLGGQGDEMLFAFGLQHDITVRLARTRWLFVSAQASARRFRFEEATPQAIGQALGVRYLLHGTLLRAADRIRLTIALTDTENDAEIWGNIFDRRIEDIFVIQDEIGDRTVSNVEVEIELKERQKALRRPTSLDAWSAYHCGNDCLYRFSPAAHEQAEAYFQLAARLDPRSARTHAGLSFLHWQRAFFESGADRRDDIARATDFAQHAVSLDPLDPQARWSLGRTAVLSGDLDHAVEELSVAVDLNPNFAKAHFSLGYGKLFKSGSAEAIDDAAKARRISPHDPMSFAYMCLFAETYALAGESDRAIVWAKRAARQPRAHHHIIAIAAWCHEMAGAHDCARRYMAKVLRQRPGYSRAEFFRAYPYAGPARSVVDGALRRLGV